MSRARDTAAARRPAPAAGFFEAGTPCRPLWLSLASAAGAPPSCAAEAALHLSEAEALLSGLEAWLAEIDAATPWPADWAWSPVAAGAAAAANAVAVWAHGHITARVGLPWALLRRLPAPPPALAAAWHWEPVPALCVLSTLELTPSEQAALEPGGMLLLPASFDSTWATTLRAEGEAPGQGLAVTLDRPDHPTWQRAVTGALPGAAWEVRCALSTPLCPTLLAGWREPGDDAIELNLRAGLDLWQLPPGDAPRRWASGRLLPWGRGQGLWIDAVAPRPEPVIRPE